MVYCTNRPCSLWLARLPEVSGAAGEEEGKAPPPPPAPRCLTPTLLSAMSPRFSPRGDKLAFLSHDAAVSSGAHFATAALLSLDFDPEAAEPAPPSSSGTAANVAAAATAALLLPRVVVPVVARPPSPDHFPGIYAAGLPDRPYVTATVLALTSQWRSSTEVLLVDLESGEVACASRPGSPETGGTRRRSAENAGDDGSSFEGSWAFLAALPPSLSSASSNSSGVGGGGWLAAVVSSPTCPPDVVVADFSAAAAEAAGAAAGTAAGGAPAVAAVAARLRWRRAARADGSPPPLRAPAAAAIARVTTRVIEVAVPAAKPRPRPRGEEEEADDGGEEGDVDDVIEVIVVSPSKEASSSLSSSNSPSSGALPPALVVPHGGPHSAHADGWALPTSFLAACGFCVLLVNFRGSTVRERVFFFLFSLFCFCPGHFFSLKRRNKRVPKNRDSRTRSLSLPLSLSISFSLSLSVSLSLSLYIYISFSLSLFRSLSPPSSELEKKKKQGYGERNLQLLPGRIGSLDVEDCVAALRAASGLGLADASRAAAVGGSHGGFLAANLLGMHPTLFKAGVLRNPVLVRVCVWCRGLFFLFRRPFLSSVRLP